MDNVDIKLTVNNTAVELSEFPEELLANVVIAIVSTLKGVNKLKDLELYQEQDNVKLTINGNELTITTFPNDVIASTLKGLISTLKGVDEIENINITIKSK